MVASLQVTNDEWYKSVRDIQWNNNMSVEQFVQYLNENQSTECLQNFTKYLEGVVFPQCTVRSFLFLDLLFLLEDLFLVERRFGICSLFVIWFFLHSLLYHGLCLHTNILCCQVSHLLLLVGIWNPELKRVVYLLLLFSKP